jgi:hypothetical protein
VQVVPYTVPVGRTVLVRTLVVSSFNEVPVLVDLYIYFFGGRKLAERVWVDQRASAHFTTPIIATEGHVFEMQNWGAAVVHTAAYGSLLYGVDP